MARATAARKARVAKKTASKRGRPSRDAFNEPDLTKGELRKLNALRKSVGDEIGTKAFQEWYRKRPSDGVENDLVASQIEELLTPALKGKKINLGRYGYTVKRARGKGASGLQVTRNEGPAG